MVQIAHFCQCYPIVNWFICITFLVPQPNKWLNNSLLHPYKCSIDFFNFKFIYRNTSDKGNKFSSYKSRGSTKKVTGNFKRGGSSSSRGGSSNSRGGFSGGGLGFMPVPQPNRSFLSSGGGTFFGWLMN